jgi:thioredoxin-like negative regulator of GroEL
VKRLLRLAFLALALAPAAGRAQEALDAAKLAPIAPIVEEVAKDYQGRVKVGKMDVDHNSATPMRYGVRGIPTLLVFKGGPVKEQIVGYVPKETIQKALDKHISG